MSAIPTEKMPEDVEMEGAPEASAVDAPAAQGDAEQPATEEMVTDEPAAAETEEPEEKVESEDKMDEDVGELVWNKKDYEAKAVTLEIEEEDGTWREVTLYRRKNSNEVVLWFGGEEYEGTNGGYTLENDKITDPDGDLIPHRNWTGPKPKGEKKKKKKDPNAPKGAKTGFLFFTASLRPELTEKGLSVPEIAKECGKRWKELSDEDKQPFQDDGEKDKARYHEEQATYLASDAYLASDFAKKKEEGGNTVEPSPAKKQTKKKKKDKNAPKGAMSAYMLFCADQRAKLKEEHPDWGLPEMGKALGAAWGLLDDAAKEPFKALAATDKERHTSEMAAYKQKKKDAGEESTEDDEPAKQVKRRKVAPAEEAVVVPATAVPVLAVPAPAHLVAPVVVAAEVVPAPAPIVAAPAPAPEVVVPAPAPVVAAPAPVVAAPAPVVAAEVVPAPIPVVAAPAPAPAAL